MRISSLAGALRSRVAVVEIFSARGATGQRVRFGCAAAGGVGAGASGGTTGAGAAFIEGSDTGAAGGVGAIGWG